MCAALCLLSGAASGAPEPAASPGDERTPLARLARAFAPRSAGEELAARVDRVRGEASRMGMWNAEPAAQGLLLADGLGDESERAAAAVRLAPGLPAAWGAVFATSPPGAKASLLWRGLGEMESNLAASVWWRATALHALAWALVAGGILFLGVSALRLAPVAAHDLFHRAPGALPPHAWAAILATLGLLPAMAGEGLLGLAAGAFLVAVPHAKARHRLALLCAMAAVLAAVHPLTGETGRWIEALHADPATVAIRDAEVGALSPADYERLQRLAPDDPAAGHALALVAKRSERLEDAWRWLEIAGIEGSVHPVLLNDAANIQLAAGAPDEAIAFYEQATRQQRNAIVLFNLAQAYGSQIELNDQARVLEAAHAISPQTIRELSALRGSGRLAVDVPWPVSDLRARLVSAADGSAVAASLRRPFGSGRLAASPLPAIGVLAVLAVALLFAARGPCESKACGLCGARRCDRCHRTRGSSCPSCGAPPEASPPLTAVRRLLAPLLLRGVPGLAGLVAEQPWTAWLSALAAATAVAAVVLRQGVVPDPLAAGLVGQMTFLLAACGAAVLSALATTSSLRCLR